MSFSITSTNSGDFSSDDCEINDDELSIVKEGDIVKTNGEQFTDQQQLKEMSEKFAKMELVLKNTKLELKNKGLQDKLKQQEMNALLAKIEAENGKMKKEIEKMHAKIDEKEKQLEKKEEQLEKKEEQLEKKEEQLEKKEEQLEKKEEQYMEKLEELQKNQKALQEDHEKKLMEQIVNLQTKVDKLEMGVSTEQIEHFQNEQKRKINALEKEQKENHMKLALLNFRQNYWNANACHNDLQITELTVHCHKRGESDGFRNIFATHPILLDEDSPGIFYFEISVKNMQHYPFGRLTFGFAAKKWTKLEGTIAPNFGTYAYSNCGYITIDGKRIEPKEDSFKYNDIVGCGINSATRQIFFTKNGMRRGPFSLDANSPSSVPDDELFPFVSLLRLGDKIEANFGPYFKFNLATL